MPLKLAITIVEIIVGVGVLLIIGDYAGHKIGRFRLVQIVLITLAVAVVAFAVLAAVELYRS